MSGLRPAPQRVELYVADEPSERAAFALVADERLRQCRKWGQQDHNDAKWIKILLEEVGEWAKADLEGDATAADAEVIQVGAVAVAWLAARLRRREEAPQPEVKP